MSIRITLGALLVGMVCAVSTRKVDADEILLPDRLDTCSGSIVVDFELQFLRPNRGDGFSRANIFGYETAPRLSVAYETYRGAGLRFQYWEFDHAVANGHFGFPSSIDAMNVDVELYKQIDLGCASTLEISGGIRYSDYRDQNVADTGQGVSFNGWGGFVGVQGWHDLACGFRGFARGKYIILAGDGNDNGNVEADAGRTQQEIGLGVERSFTFWNTITTLEAGVEWQNWEGYQDDSDGNIGFSGYFLGVNIQH